MNKDDVAGLVERYEALKKAYLHFADKYCDLVFDRNAKIDALTTLSARVETLEAALQGLLGNEIAEERIGWRGASPSSPHVYQCEYCHKEHEDCTEIEHLDDCPILAARKALAGDTNHG